MDNQRPKLLFRANSNVFGQQSGLFHARTDDLSVSTYNYLEYAEAGNRASFGRAPQKIGRVVSI